MHSRIATLILASFVCVSAARAQAPTYELTFLGHLPLPTIPVVPKAVNDFGVVVGYADDPTQFQQVPFVAAPNQPLTLLPLLNGDPYGEARAINDAGVIVGFTSFPSAQLHAVRWVPTPNGYVVFKIPLSQFGFAPKIANAVNELGDIVGSFTNDQGFHWSAATGTVGLAQYGFTAIATAINEHRQVVGDRLRIDLDTHLVSTVTALPPGTILQCINDAGVCIWKAPVTVGHYAMGTYEFGLSPAPFAYANLIDDAKGIDYASNAIYQDNFGPGPTGIVVHFDSIGEFALQSLLDPAFAQWQIEGKDCAVSPAGRIAVRVSNASLGLAGVALLTPKPFQAILQGAEGAAGLPVLAGEGTLQPGTPLMLRLARAAPNAPLGLIAGSTRADLPFYGGLLVPAPTLVLTGLQTNAFGTLTITAQWPTGIASGTKLYLQEWIADASAPFGVAGSNALECVVP